MKSKKKKITDFFFLSNIFSRVVLPGNILE